jgi:transposase-like protein
MPERNMHKKDTIIDKKLWENLPVSDRTRQFQTVEVKCRSCGKTESVNPVLVDSVERYKCNRCSTSAG